MLLKQLKIKQNNKKEDFFSLLLGSLAVPLIKNVFGRLTGRRDVRTGEYILRTDKDFSCYLIL